MGHHEYRSARVIDLPGKKNTVRYQWRFNAQNVEESLSDTKVLRLTSL
jgi:hypothetical protein